MTIRFAMLAALSLIPVSALAAPLPAKMPVAAALAPAPMVRVALTTAMGKIVVELDRAHAPVTTANFLRYVDQKRFDGIVFYRAMRLDWGTPPNGLVQAGVQGDPKRVLKSIAHESTTQTGILHKAGAISMARWAVGTAAGDFSILLSDMPSLDANPSAPGDNAGYAAFGHVVEGMEVARKIWDAPLSATKGEGALKGQLLEVPVKVISARRVPMPVAPVKTP
jgi:peptidyl-prolyl cis-trans isomerase A (cyclophilin A)